MEQDDMAVWADGTWCYGHELHEMTHMSDDYEVVKLGSGVYQLLSDLIDEQMK